VVVNTLIYDHEFPEALKLIQQIHQSGADALIIQDTGLLECELPPIPLFASTQMHNYTPACVAFLEKVGFQRAILARELTLEQIREIRQQTSLEPETFIHGALCVCHSGQCTLSYASGGRTPAQGALGWSWGRSPKIIPIPGFRTVKQVAENACAMEFGPLTQAQYLEIEDILGRKN
jgi:putative protease